MAKAKEETTAKKKRSTSTKYNFYKRDLTIEYMKNYIENLDLEKFPEFKSIDDAKKWFKDIAFRDDKYQHLIAKREFCKKFMPEKLPEKTNRPKKSDILKDW